ncbi:DinB family protein [Terrabacter sp. Soil811]|uniref:DinB family protein n=1 Tax=Terrabacter sp. Soil811 TaxID=1736419 RepID=UPI000AC10E1F|nr:DinB family protein [Terrabacter sp. Soil811]
MSDVTYDDQQGARFERVRLTGATFEDVYLDGARLHDVDLRGASLRMVDLRGLRARDVWLEDVDITGDVGNLVINGVDVAPLIEAELDRRDPDRPKMRPTDAAGYREGWDVVERLWAGTVERARTFTPEQLHERVDGEWSFIETQRHLVFATDAWVCRALLGDPEPWDALDLPHDDMPDSPPVPRDRVARPTLDEVLALRADRMATVRRVVDGLTDDDLARTTEPVTAAGYPEPEPYAVTRILRTILNEEWQHRLYAERDLDTLAAREDSGVDAGVDAAVDAGVDAGAVAR